MLRQAYFPSIRLNAQRKPMRNLIPIGNVEAGVLSQYSPEEAEADEQMHSN
jgi:hypothetical protein